MTDELTDVVACCYYCCGRRWSGLKVELTQQQYRDRRIEPHNAIQGTAQRNDCRYKSHLIIIRAKVM